eukprot:2095069-Rhodomonas_salina.1
MLWNDALTSRTDSERSSVLKVGPVKRALVACCPEGNVRIGSRVTTVKREGRLRCKGKGKVQNDKPPGPTVSGPENSEFGRLNEPAVPVSAKMHCQKGGKKGKREEERGKERREVVECSPPGPTVRGPLNPEVGLLNEPLWPVAPKEV